VGLDGIELQWTVVGLEELQLGVGEQLVVIALRVGLFGD
jgi:hypothetical protein